MEWKTDFIIILFSFVIEIYFRIFFFLNGSVNANKTIAHSSRLVETDMISGLRIDETRKDFY